MAAADRSPFDALVFDLGGVVVAHDNAKLLDRLASQCAGRPAAALKTLVSEPRWGTGAPLTDLHRRLQDDFGYGGDWDAFAEDWCCHFELHSSMLDLLDRLAKTHRVILWSNTNKVHWEFLVELSEGRLGKFEAYLSHEVGLAKPSVESFRAVARAAGIDPARSIFFDDLPENVEGARRAGFQAEVFRSEAELVRLLRGRGVDWD